MTSTAKWIWYDDPGYELLNSYMQARREVRVSQVPKRVVIRVTADSRYRLYVNGAHVNRGPARGVQEHWPVDELEIAPHLVRGMNVIAAIVHNLGIGTFQYVHQGYAGFWLEGRIGREDISSGRDWRVRPAPGIRKHAARVCLQLGFQEHVDARANDDRWMHAGIQPGADWREPHCRETGAMPWHSLEEREIPLLGEGQAAPAVLASTASGTSAASWQDSADVVSLYVSEKKTWRPAEVLLAGRADGAILKIEPTVRGAFKAYCVDFGEELVGSIRLEVNGAAGGEVIDMLVTELVDEGVPVIAGPSAGCRVALGNRLVLRPGRTSHEQFDHWGFRYLVLVARGVQRPLNVRIQLATTGYPLEVKARFQSSNERLNRIYEICVRAQRRCMLDAYVDCPWREQAQWWGDARVQAHNTFILAADARLLARGIRQIAAQEVPNGLTYGHAPTISHGCILPDFTVTWLLTHWDYYWQTGDLTLFCEHRERIARAISYFESSIAASSGPPLLSFDRRYWLFLDWCDLFKDGYPTLYNMMYLAAMRTMAQLARLVGWRAEQKRYARIANRHERATIEFLFDKRRGLFYDGLTWRGKEVRTASPHAAAWAILLDLERQHHRSMGKEVLLPLIAGNPGDAPLTPTPFFMYYIFQALKKLGHDRETICCIERWWGQFLEMGVTTTPEVWTPDPGNGSLCHAWSAHPIVHFSEILLGVRQRATNWNSVDVRPLTDYGDWCEGAVATPHGLVNVSWEKGKPPRVSLPRRLKNQKR